MKRLLCFQALLCLLCSAYGQPAPLHPGDIVPDMALTTFLPAAGKAPTLAAYKKKLLLLSFWATNCGACAAEMPVLDSLQRLYPKDLAILMVTSGKGDTKERVARFLGRVRGKNGQPVALPVILDDSVLNQYFPHPYVPYFAWLDSNLRVVATTGPEEASPESIAAFVRGEPLSFMEKEDMRGFDPAAPLFIQGNGGSGRQLRQRSSLCGYIPGMPTLSHTRRDSAGMVTGILLSNLPLIQLFRFAYDYYGPDSMVRLPAGAVDSLSTSGKRAAWVAAHSYTYELVTPPVSKARALGYLRQDLERFFGYTAAVQPVLLPCLVLTTDSILLQQYATRGGKKINSLSDPTHPLLTNQSMAVIANALGNRIPLPVIDESGYPGRVDLDLGGIRLRDIPSVKASFARYGILLTETLRPFPALFITQLPNSSL